MVRHLRLRDPQPLDELPDGQFALRSKQFEDPQPDRVAEAAEVLRDQVRLDRSLRQAERRSGSTHQSATISASLDMTRRLSIGCSAVAHALLHRLHNPHGLECACDPDCWCRRTAIGRAVKWWFPARMFGIHHQNQVFEGMSKDEIREWKRRQALR